MGMVCETDGGVAIAAKPKERQFQVVPMPGVFSRGRWKCWDYKDSADTPAFNREERDILEFDARADRAENLVPNAAAVQEEPIFLTPPREVGEHPATSTIMVTSMALHESSPRISQAPSAVSSLTLEAASITIASLPPNISVGGSSDFHRPGTIPPMQSPSLPATVVNTTISSLTSTSYGTTMTMLDATSAATGSSQLGGPSVVAIDNKIEQAMDLVKTHLTYAVREEVEVLRSSIVDLEAKVIRLENENALLRQVAPPEIVAQLPYLVAAAQQQQQNQSATPQQPQNLNPTQSPSQVGSNVSEQ